MKLTRIFLFAFSALLLVTRAAAKDSTATNVSVRCDIALSADQWKSGAHGALNIRLTPIDGVHINIDPPIELEMKNVRWLKFPGTLIVPVSNDSVHFDAGQPIIRDFVLDPKTPPGDITLHGTLSYFFCSDEKGWCNHFEQPINVVIRVLK
jgi:hypothetical protein